MFIIKFIGIIACIDIFITVAIAPLGMISTCDRCNKKFDGTFLWNIALQLCHRCEDNLV